MDKNKTQQTRLFTEKFVPKANDLTRQVVDFLNGRGYKVWRQNNHAVWDAKIQKYRKNPQALKGIPDVVGFCKKTGKTIFVEIKVGKDKLRPEQEQFLKEAKEAFCLTFVAHTFEQFTDEFFDNVTLKK